MTPLKHFKDEKSKAQRWWAHDSELMNGARTGIRVCLTSEPMFLNTALSYLFANILRFLLGAVFSLCPKLLEGMCISQASPERQNQHCVHIYTYTQILCSHDYGDNDKSHNLQLASWRPRRAHDINPVQAEGLGTRGAEPGVQSWSKDRQLKAWEELMFQHESKGRKKSRTNDVPI